MILVLTVADSFKNFSGGVQSSGRSPGLPWDVTKTVRLKRGVVTFMLAVIGIVNTTPTSRLELKVPPVALMVIMAALMWAVALITPALDFILPAHVAASVSVSLLGALTCLGGVASFRLAKTTVNPLRPDSTAALVVSGIYKYSRNPMYLGFVLILFGWALLLLNALALLLLPAFVLYMSRFQIFPEERALLSLFGKDYTEYHARVRRWL